MCKYPERFFDLIYVDGVHDYSGVKSDANLASKKIKDDGIIVFNDYILHDQSMAPYGVVHVVNEMVVAGEWQIVGFALQRHMFCDIAIRRTQAIS